MQDGIPCTSVARTLVDLGDVVPGRHVERALEQAEILRVFDLGAVRDALARAGPRRGAGILRAILGEWAPSGLTDRELEERFLALCRDAGLPQPAVNAPIAIPGEEFRVDFLWRSERLIVETDSYEFHHTRRSFEGDRLRDQRLTLAGYSVIRMTWRQIERDPGLMAETVGALLGR
jgi:hypothetical protein